jgi:hypothetical protein
MLSTCKHAVCKRCFIRHLEDKSEMISTDTFRVLCFHNTCQVPISLTICANTRQRTKRRLYKGHPFRRTVLSSSRVYSFCCKDGCWNVYQTDSSFLNLHVSQLPDTNVHAVRQRATCGVVMRVQRVGEGRIEAGQGQPAVEGILHSRRGSTLFSEVRQETAKP